VTVPRLGHCIQDHHSAKFLLREFFSKTTRVPKGRPHQCFVTPLISEVIPLERFCEEWEKHGPYKRIVLWNVQELIITPMYIPAGERSSFQTRMPQQEHVRCAHYFWCVFDAVNLVVLVEVFHHHIFHWPPEASKYLSQLFSCTGRFSVAEQRSIHQQQIYRSSSVANSSWNRYRVRPDS